MQRYTLKSLVGLFVVVATCQVVSGRSQSLFHELAKGVQAEYQAAPVNTSPDDANMIRSFQSDEPSKRHKNKKKEVGNFVTVELEGQGREINEGESFELTCNVQANPEPKVFWIRGNIPPHQIDELFKTSVPAVSSRNTEVSIWQVRSKYVVDCANQQDQGQIHCVAISGAKTLLESAVISVIENGNGTRGCETNRAPVITYSVPTVFSLIETSVVLPCTAVGTPKPQTTWFRMDDSGIMSNFDDSRYMTLADGSLLIQKIVWEDMGVVICIAKSSSGEARAETFLYPLKKKT